MKHSSRLALEDRLLAADDVLQHRNDSQGFFEFEAKIVQS